MLPRTMQRTGEVLRIGRYELAGQLATGGMAAVHLGRIRGAQGFSRVVIIKRILPELAQKPDFVRMFVNEAKLAARVRHPNVVATLDAVEHGSELLLVIEFVHGLSLAKLVSLASSCNGRIPLRIGAAIVASALRGLHAAHEAKDEVGRSLTIVHRDMSPQNVLVGRDGLARVLDFGVAKAVDETRNLTLYGEFKGKMTYAAPEQVFSQKVSPATDIYAAGLVFWELATGQRRYGTMTHGAIIKSLSDESVPMPSQIDRRLPAAVDRIIHFATQKNPTFRYRTAADMAREIEEQIGVAPAHEVGAWLMSVAAPELKRLDDIVASVEAINALPSGGFAIPGARAIATPDDRTDFEGSLSRTEFDLAPKLDPAAKSGTKTGSSMETSSSPSPSPSRKHRHFPLVPVLGVSAGAALVLALGFVAANANRPAPPPRKGELHVATETLSSASYTSVVEKDETNTSPSPSSSAASALPSSSSSNESAPKRIVPTPTTTTTPPPDCAPPYFVDPTGIKHIKPGCG